MDSERSIMGSEQVRCPTKKHANSFEQDASCIEYVLYSFEQGASFNELLITEHCAFICVKKRFCRVQILFQLS